MAPTTAFMRLLRTVGFYVSFFTMLVGVAMLLAHWTLILLTWAGWPGNISLP